VKLAVITVGKKSVTVLKANGKTTKYPRGRIRMIRFVEPALAEVDFEERRDGDTLRRTTVSVLRAHP